MPPKKDLSQKETELEETSLDLYNQGLIRAQPGQGISFLGSSVRELTQTDFGGPMLNNYDINLNHIIKENNVKRRITDESHTNRYLKPFNVPRPILSENSDFYVAIKYTVLFNTYCTYNQYEDEFSSGRFFVIDGSVCIPMRHEYYNYLKDPLMFVLDEKTNMYNLFTDQNVSKNCVDIEYVNYDLIADYTLLSNAYYTLLSSLAKIIIKVLKTSYCETGTMYNPFSTCINDSKYSINFFDGPPNDLVLSELDVYNGKIGNYSQLDDIDGSPETLLDLNEEELSKLQ